MKLHTRATSRETWKRNCSAIINANERACVNIRRAPEWKFKNPFEAFSAARAFVYRNNMKRTRMRDYFYIKWKSGKNPLTYTCKGQIIIINVIFTCCKQWWALTYTHDSEENEIYLTTFFRLSYCRKIKTIVNVTKQSSSRWFKNRFLWVLFLYLKLLKFPNYHK